jgi:prepilin-type N-terminal cleavage/methylation domain-containing protein/prepilin-type processing-associated H-X9-DG protein
MTFSQPKRTGFTLIELLVVIAIIAILAAILFPVFAQAKESAKKTSCLSNMKQIALANAMYTNDSDGVFPFAWFCGDDGCNSWNTVLYPYIKSGGKDLSVGFDKYDGVWNCPSSAHKGVSYSANALVLGGGANAGWAIGGIYEYRGSESESSVDRIASVLLTTEANPWFNPDGSFMDFPTDFPRPIMDFATPVSNRSDEAVAWYQQWLKVDLTSLRLGVDTVPAEVALAGNPKGVAWRHTRSGNNTGSANGAYLDGHAKASRFGSLKVENWFPQLTEQQLANYNN